MVYNIASMSANLTDDSRLVRPGDTFVAIKGLNVDGHDYVGEAIKRGARIIYGEKDLKVKNYVKVGDSRAKLAELASLQFDNPSQKLKIIGVTGTDGKTTTTHLIHHILKTSGKKASMVSSVYAEIGGQQYDTGFHVTTPDSWMLQKFLRQAADAPDEYMVLEVTSHGLDQNRVWGIEFEIGVLTNITHEHLDYHVTYKSYVKAKEQLLYRSKISVVNRDDESYDFLDPRFRKDDSKNVITYAIKESADVTPKKFSFVSPLPGEYNRSNCLAAIAAAQKLGVAHRDIKKALKTFEGIKGRFEKVPTKSGFEVIIDFAHTPNAIEKVLAAVEPETKGKLIHVFGSAALRDHAKRPVMGRNSAAHADLIVLTEEDYRTEDVNQIIEEIAQGCIQNGAQEFKITDYKKALKSAKTAFFRIPSRTDAVDFAVTKLAQKNDTVILTGKAHEKSLCRGTTEYPWSEHEAVESALKKR